MDSKIIAVSYEKSDWQNKARWVVFESGELLPIAKFEVRKHLNSKRLSLLEALKFIHLHSGINLLYRADGFNLTSDPNSGGVPVHLIGLHHVDEAIKISDEVEVVTGAGEIPKGKRVFKDELIVK